MDKKQTKDIMETIRNTEPYTYEKVNVIKQLLLPSVVEIETSTYCNRQCEWCPNSKHSRGREHNFMDQTLFKKIIGDLRNIDYHDSISLHNYNEPLLDPNIYERVQYVHEQLPDAEIRFFTNGDFLNLEKCYKLETAGVSLLWITLHEVVDHPAPHAMIEEHWRHVINTTGSIDLVDKTDLYGFKQSTSFGNMKLLYYVPYISTLSSRGGLLEKFNHSIDTETVCLAPFTCSAIDYQGNMKICYDIYPDHAPHREKGLVGSLAKYSFTDLWFSDKYNEIRMMFLRRDCTNGICEHCVRNNLDEDSHTIMFEELPIWENFLEILETIKT